MSPLTNATADLGVTVRIVDADDWEHGDAKDVCKYRELADLQPIVEAKARTNQADFPATLIHERTHALLYVDIDNGTERSKRELAAETIGYIFGQHFGLNSSGSAFYLTIWQGDKPAAIFERLERISSTVRAAKFRSLEDIVFGGVRRPAAN